MVVDSWYDLKQSQGKNSFEVRSDVEKLDHGRTSEYDPNNANHFPAQTGRYQLVRLSGLALGPTVL